MLNTCIKYGVIFPLLNIHILCNNVYISWYKLWGISAGFGGTQNRDM